jgi:L-lysine 2,3-aminomutase
MPHSHDDGLEDEEYRCFASCRFCTVKEFSEQSHADQANKDTSVLPLQL